MSTLPAEMVAPRSLTKRPRSSATCSSSIVAMSVPMSSSRRCGDMRCLKHGPPTLRQRGLNVAATVARPGRELGEELGVGVLDRLARVDPQFLAQQDPEAFIRRKRLGHVAAR